MLSFAVISLALTLGLGLVLSLQIDRSINEHSVRDLTRTTTSAVALASNLILTDVSASGQGIQSATAKLHETQLMNAASEVLRKTGSAVAVEALYRDRSVIAGSGGARFLSTVPPDQGFRAAMQGQTVTRVMRHADPGDVSAVERQLLARNGDLLELQTGFRLSPSAPVLVVVRAYAAMGPTEHQASATPVV